jgi:hypothetical protein
MAGRLLATTSFRRDRCFSGRRGLPGLVRV